VTIALLVLFAFADLAGLKAEPDLNRRSELALTNADEDIDQARKAYQEGDQAAVEAAIRELSESVTLSYDALQQTHTAPRKSKYYKRAELKVSALMRRLAGLRDEVSFDFRPPVDAALKTLSDVHDELLSEIMSRKK
jgi:hypothetical protein